ncbi:MAG: response regulator [Polyangiaceae bacterium]
MTGRVLVCDDEAGVRFALGESLRARGHAVVEVAGGAEALAAIDDVDVVVTDLAMPGMDGLALLGEIRSRDPSLPVIVVTARGSERAAVDAMKRGAYDYLAKPFDIDELAFTVARALESSALRRDAERSRAERATGRALLGERRHA